MLMMMEKQLGQELGIGGVVVGATGLEGFTETFEGDGIDGVNDEELGMGFLLH